jgi:hypothetical protein
MLNVFFLVKTMLLKPPVVSIYKCNFYQIYSEIAQ